MLPDQVWGSLNNTPAISGVIPHHDLCTLAYRARVTSKSQKREKQHYQFLPPDIKRDYTWVFPQIHDVYFATSRFADVVPEHTEADVQRWLSYLRQNFPNSGQSRLVEFGELIVKMTSAPGPLADGVVRTTRELLRWYGARVWTYWKYARTERWPCFWKTTGKTEMLPNGKAPRTFVFLDKLIGLCFARATSDFNNMFKTDRFQTRSAIGGSIYGAEFIDMANRLDRYSRVIISDVSKWDAHMPQAMFRAISLFRQESMTSDLGKDWIAYKYEAMANPLVFMPSGELVRLEHGNMSGQDSTSTDNTMGHDLLVEDAIQRTRSEGGICLNFIKLYGDDFVGSVSDESAELFAKNLRATYLKHGFVVKEDAFKIQVGLEGATFLGGEFQRCKVHGCWTYVPSAKKLLESAYFSDRDLTDEQLLGKIHSLYVLAFHTEWRSIFRNLYLRARALVAEPPPYWSEVVIENFVHGLEGPVHVECLPEDLVMA